MILPKLTNSKKAQIARREHNFKKRIFTQTEPVLARSYITNEKWVPALILAKTGPISYTIQSDVERVW